MFFEDFAEGQRFKTATRTVSEAEVIDFAEQWDPQSFHLDPVAAEASIFGGLIGSGFHTLLIAFNLVLEADIWREASQGSPGIEELKWLRPMRPGDSLTVEMEAVEVRRSATRGDRGYVTWEYTVTNQTGEPVMTYRSMVICLRRNPLPDPG